MVWKLRWRIKSLLMPGSDNGLTQSLIWQVQSARVIRANLRYAGIWWFRSRANPSTAIEALILQIDGKSKPWSETGRVEISELKTQGNPGMACTLAATCLSSLMASKSIMGWKVRRAHARDVIDCMVILRMRVMGIGPMNLGKVKASMKFCSSWKQKDGLLILTLRNSNSLETSGTVWWVIVRGDTPGWRKD